MEGNEVVENEGVANRMEIGGRKIFLFLAVSRCDLIWNRGMARVQSGRKGM